jgi:hypothetical protein
MDVERAFRSGPGQARIRELVAALDAMPRHELADGALAQTAWLNDDDNSDDVQVCALGALGAARELARAPGQAWADAAAGALRGLDGEDFWEVAHWAKRELGWPKRSAVRVQWINDEELADCEPPERWVRMRAWLVSQLGDPDPWRHPPTLEEIQDARWHS